MKNYLSICFIISLLVVSGNSCKTVSSYTTYPLAFYEVEAKGDAPQLKLRMISDFSSVVPNQKFKIGFFFKVQNGWYTYTNQDGQDNIPTEIKINLPPGFEILKEKWSPPVETEDKDHGGKTLIYDKDFTAIYTLRTAHELPDTVTINANVSWQVCRSELCTLGAAQLSCELQTGKRKRSELYPLLRPKN